MEEQYRVFYQAAVQPFDQAAAVDNPALSGLDLLSPDDQESVRVAITLLVISAKSFLACCQRCGVDIFKSYGSTSRTMLNMVVPDTASSSPQAFSYFLKRPHLPTDAFRERARSDDATTCTCAWGPPEGPVRDLLSVSSMMFYAWLGAPLANPILDFVYAFCTGPTSWASAWLHCPSQHEHLDFTSLPSRVSAMRARSTSDRPATVVAQLATLAISAIEPALRSLYICVEILPPPTAFYFEEQLYKATLAQVAAAAAKQYEGIVRTTLVLTTLPTVSSLPSYSPNFTDDLSTTWFRTAEYFFTSIQFPLNDAVRGDASAERKWHHYVCEVLNNRVLCMKLSEAQVIKHLSKTFTRDSMHFQTATEKAQSPQCTVREWLDAIRDFFFTNGQFRMHVESAWNKYRAGQATSFNDLVHHIRIYYQLVFLDYSSLPGKMSLQDFAWNLFDKLQYLMSSDCQSELGTTIKMFMPLPELLGKLAAHLEHSHMWPTDKANAAALSFVTWCVDKLNSAKETANTAKRYAMSNPQHHQGVDFASTATPLRDIPVHPRRVNKPATMAYTNAHHPNHAPPRAPYARAPAKIGPYLQSPLPSPMPSSRPSRPDLPGLREARRLTFQQRKAWVLSTMDSEKVPSWIKQAFQFEQANTNAPFTIHALAAACRQHAPYFLPYTPVAVAMYLLEAHFVHGKRVCGFCPSTMPDADRHHDIKNCPTASALAPSEHAAFVGHPDNANKALMDADPQAPITSSRPPPPPPAPASGSAGAHNGPTNNRKRYDTPTQSAFNKRARSAAPSNHVR